MSCRGLTLGQGTGEIKSILMITNCHRRCGDGYAADDVIKTAVVTGDGGAKVSLNGIGPVDM